MSKSFDQNTFNEAVKWNVRLNDCPPDPETEQDFALWLSKDESHETAYEAVLSLLDAMQPLADGYSNDIEKLQSEEKRRPRFFFPGMPAIDLIHLAGTAAIAACFFVAALLVFPFADYSSAERYATGLGEVRRVTLSDGSVMHLNTATQATFKIFKNGRDVSLLSGEAYFIVKHDVARPFRVLASDIVVQAVGTEFNVNTDEGEIRIDVFEGKVRTENKSHSDMTAQGLQLTTGEAAIYSHTVDEIDIVENVAAAEASWREGFLVYDAASLEDVLRDLSRYTGETYFLASGDLDKVLVSGILLIEGGRGIKTALTETYGLKFHPAQGEIVRVERAQRQSD